jgi:hypothetical protein
MFARTAFILTAGLILVTPQGCTNLPSGPASTPAATVRGVTLADWTPDGYARPSALVAIDDIAALGANTVVLIVTAYQPTIRSNRVTSSRERTPTATAVTAAISRARARGLDVVLKLHVDVESGEWRGRIAPEDPETWFASYGAFVDSWTRTAANLRVDGLVVGTELAGTLDLETSWRALVGRVRSLFGGEVLYAASWDEARLVGFWDALDAVGVDFYGSVSVRANPGRLEILTGWQPWIERLYLLHGQTGKPVLLTEIGYRSVDGAGLDPFRFGGNEALDVGEQADLYWAALQATGDKDWIDGMYWWNWLTDGSGGESNRDYTPKGKPAEQELVNAW